MKADSSVPFGAASAARPLGDGTFVATLRPEWSIDGHPHGGFLLALMARTAAERFGAHDEPAVEPISVSAHFLRAPSVGPVLLRTDVRKAGRRTAVVTVTLEQRGRSCVETTVVLGRLPATRALWADVPPLPAEPPPNAIVLGRNNMGDGVFRLADDCEVRIDPAAAAVSAGARLRPSSAAGTGVRPLQMRLWARSRSGPADLYFAIVAGDINPPVPFRLGRVGWAPSVQLTALVRARPASGWLRILVECRAVHGSWFDSDATVIDSAGNLICQSRQLAVTPGP